MGPIGIWQRTRGYWPCPTLVPPSTYTAVFASLSPHKIARWPLKLNSIQESPWRNLCPLGSLVSRPLPGGHLTSLGDAVRVCRARGAQVPGTWLAWQPCVLGTVLLVRRRTPNTGKQVPCTPTVHRPQSSNTCRLLQFFHRPPSASTALCPSSACCSLLAVSLPLAVFSP